MHAIEFVVVILIIFVLAGYLFSYILPELDFSVVEESSDVFLGKVYK